jgi:Tfp pilus assembly protein PilF
VNTARTAAPAPPQFKTRFYWTQKDGTVSLFTEPPAQHSPRLSYLPLGLRQLVFTGPAPVEAPALSLSRAQFCAWREDLTCRDGFACSGAGQLDAGPHVEEIEPGAAITSPQEPHVELLTAAMFLYSSQHHDEARQLLEQAVALRPDLATAHHGLGCALKGLGQYERALASIEEALRLAPDYAAAMVNHGACLLGLGRLDEALGEINRGLDLVPDFADAYVTLGELHHAAHRFDESMACLRRAHELDPDNRRPLAVQGFSWLLRGDFTRGWAAYTQAHGNDPPPWLELTTPKWDGSPLGGRAVLLACEQGLGDTLQLVRYAPLLKLRGARRVIVECPASLIPVLARTPGIDELFTMDRLLPEHRDQRLPAHDVYVASADLPPLFGTTLETIPGGVPYVQVDPARVEAWRQRLAAVPGFRVGITWQGNPLHGWDRQRSVPIERFAPLAAVPGVSLVSLQQNDGKEQLATAPFPVTDPGDGQPLAYEDSAAVIANMDLIIAVDTSLAHAAGAMGRPTWLALCHTPDWRWLLGRDDSPWYPTLRIFRQTRLGDWSPVFREMAVRLQAMLPAA